MEAFQFKSSSSSALEAMPFFNFEVLEENASNPKKCLNYYPFGSEMPGRKFVSGDAYKHGYQGQFTEKDEEVNWDAFELRNWDGRLARWTSIDPYHQHWSPYLGMGNDPINLTDPDGGRVDDIFVKKNGSFSVVETNGPDRFFFEGDNGGWTLGNGYAGPDGFWKTTLGAENATNVFNSYTTFFKSEFGSKLLNDDFFNAQIHAIDDRQIQSQLVAARTSEAIGTYGTQTVAVIGAVTGGVIAGGELLGAATYHQIGASLLRYKNANGVGLKITKEGKSLIRFDWHKFRIGGRKLGRDVNRPHVDIPGRGVKHWPWHQIDKIQRGVK